MKTAILNDVVELGALAAQDPTPISICGSSWRSSYANLTFMAVAFDGWTETRASSKLKIPLGLQGFGENEKIDQPWITTSWADQSGNTTKRGLWRRQKDPKDWFISSVTHTGCRIALDIEEYLCCSWPVAEDLLLHFVS